MFKTLINAWKIEDLRKKIIYTLMMLLIYRIGAHVPIPGVNVAYIAEQVGKYDILGFMDILSGGGLSSLTVFALGIIPYINASIIMNLLTIAIPPLERLAKQGEEGKKKIASITRYAAVVLGLIQSIGILLGMGENAVLSTNWFNYVTIVLCLTAGTALIMWIGEKITENGIGNGISLIIFISIISRFPKTVFGLFQSVGAGTLSIIGLIIIIIAALAVVTGITFVDMGERRIPVQYAKRVVGRKVYGGQSTHIPMKINQSGVLPLIFAMTLIQFPGMIAQFVPNSTFYEWYVLYMGQGTAIYAIVYALLIMFFTFFYTQITFNPIEVSKNMQQYGGFIPGIRPGKPTSDYLSKILTRITLFGAIFLAIVATVPTLFATSSGLQAAFSATSLLIMVNVSLETTKQIESQMMMRHYKGFLK